MWRWSSRACTAGSTWARRAALGPVAVSPPPRSPPPPPIGALRAHLYCRARAARGARPSARGRHPARVGRRTGARRFPRSSRGGSAPRRARARARRPEEAKGRGHSSGGGAGGDGQARHARAGGRAQAVRWWRVGLISGRIWGAGASRVSLGGVLGVGVKGRHLRVTFHHVRGFARAVRCSGERVGGCVRSLAAQP